MRTVMLYVFMVGLLVVALSGLYALLIAENNLQLAFGVIAIGTVLLNMCTFDTGLKRLDSVASVCLIVTSALGLVIFFSQ